jgi:membrane-bound metal-dependent hydrolase YbcI (DUF457 family)
MSLTIKYFYPEVDNYTLYSAALFGSFLPDSDTKKSVMYQLFSPFAFVVDKLTKHRGATHSILPIVLICTWFVFQSQLWILFIGLGCLNHYLLDIITIKLHIHCNSVGEMVLYYLFWILSILLMGYLIHDKYIDKLLLLNYN